VKLFNPFSTKETRRVRVMIVIRRDKPNIHLRYCLVRREDQRYVHRLTGTLLKPPINAYLLGGS
jgi:hypothetical protein